VNDVERKVTFDLNAMGMGTIEVGGVNIANLVAEATVRQRAGEPTVVELTLLAVEVEGRFYVQDEAGLGERTVHLKRVGEHR
jgi:hypothetical protein